MKDEARSERAHLRRLLIDYKRSVLFSTEMRS